MAEPSSRRSFLFGRQATAHDQWSKFVVSLRRASQGTVKLVADQQAHLQPATFDDVIQARKLCHAHQIVMALDGLTLPAADGDRCVLWVEAGSAWGSLIPLGETGLWRVDAGCPLPVMQAAQLLQTRPEDRSANLAQWFARAYRRQLLSTTSLAAHLHSVDWLLPDGTIEVFGAFGATDAQPLGSLAAQKLVPKLFELSMRPDVQAAMADGVWPSCLHLDALTDTSRVNLAHFFVGHGGALGWLVAATFKKTDAPLSVAVSECHSAAGLAELDRQTKSIIDPTGMFMSLAQQTG